MGSLLARAYKRILSGKLAQDAGEHWVTVNAGSKEGGEGGGSHVLLDGEGRVVAGMGGKFKGQNIDRIERKKFINQNAWNRQRKALTEKASDTERSVNHLHVKALMDPEKSINWHTAVGQKNLEKVLDRSKADTTGMGLINKLHTGIDAETELMRIDKEQKERAREEELKKLDETIKREQARREYLASPEGQAEEKRNRLKKEVAYRKNERLKEQQRQDELQKLIRGDRKDFADQNLHTPEAQAFYFGTFNKLSWGLAQKSTEERNRILADARAEYEKVKGDISEKTRASIDEHLAYLDRATAIIDRLRKNTQKQQEAPKAEEPKANRKSLIDQVNARHTMPMGDIIARKEQAITDKINNSNLSEADKKKYLDKLNSLTDEALKAGAGSLDLYKVGVSYKKTNAESNAFNKMFSKQSEIDNLEKEINKKVQDNVTQSENKSTLNSLNEAERTGAVYFKDANGKEFYRANSKSKTWYQIDQYNQAKGEKAKAKQRAKDAGLAVKEEQPRSIKNAFSDKYQKIDNSNLNKYQKVDNISNNKNTENGVTNMNTNQESQAKTYEGNKLASYYNQHGVKALENANEQEHVKINGEVYVKQADGSWTNPETKATASTNQIADKLNTVISKSLEEQYSGNPFNLHALRGGSMQISPSAHKGEQSAVVKFFNKPEQSTIDMLKQNGFKWMQSKKSWVHNGEIGNKSHLDVLKALKGVAPAPQPSQATPTAQPRQATPTQQAEGKQYHGTGIENKNGRYEVSFNEFPSYKLRTDMKANGFKWDPNAKVWHTTDREKLDQVMSKHFTERT